MNADQKTKKNVTWRSYSTFLRDFHKDLLSKTQYVDYDTINTENNQKTGVNELFFIISKMRHAVTMFFYVLVWMNFVCTFYMTKKYSLNI